jgi:hypothetical protein
MSRYAIDNVEEYTRPIGKCLTLEWAWNGRQSSLDSDASDNETYGEKPHEYDPKYRRFRHVSYHIMPLSFLSSNRCVAALDCPA